MKKLLLLAALILSATGIQAQTKTTGTVNLLSGMTAEIMLNEGTSTATLTFTGPSDRWFALQFGDFSTGGGMGNGEDVVYYNNTTLVDAVHNGIGSAPSTDAVNDWAITSNTVSGATRTIVATRAFNTGNTGDYTFVYSDATIDFAYSRSSSASYALAYHGASNRGYQLNRTFECVAPDAPTATAQSLCAGSTVADLTATGTVLNWYTESTGGTALSDATGLITGTYHVSQTVDACESDRTAVTVTINTTPLPTVTATQDFCGSATVADLDATGTALSWYDVATDGTALATDAALVSGSYYVEQTLGGCTSTARAEVTVNIITLVLPTADDQTFCGGATLEDVVAAGTGGNTLAWYDDAAGGTALPLTTMLNTGNYFVSQLSGTCESDREEVIITVNLTPIAPMGDAVQEFTDGELISDLDITTIGGATITWYMMNAGMELVEVNVDTALIDGGEYYVSQTVDGCESLTFMVTANAALSIDTLTKNNVVVYPNPATDVFIISGETAITKVVVFNLLGQNVISQETDSEEVNIDVSALGTGTYIIDVYNASGAKTSLKVVKQ
ncbi:MAG: hypothetical protein BM557_08365 [Flavobacterium sp. MedPE-SWcel]|uniref:Ig-like domain-containing protein n=1 Tax=uncultured Flavobacterium sp. TaxID=165435 RepID=UPI000912F795|nr:T9SS type A sorting domain-containing protein [uncultured Flavobacterium sp.]OIQ17691.1 MAG: hypothetical protein BM557_08365 [Flavobacterium sp. MedPE-SWcel]